MRLPAVREKRSSRRDSGQHMARRFTAAGRCWAPQPDRVVGSSPTWGAKRKGIAFAVPFFFLFMDAEKGKSADPA